MPIFFLAGMIFFVSEGIVAKQEQQPCPTDKDLEPILQAETETFKQQKKIVQDIQSSLPKLTQELKSVQQEMIPELNRLLRLKNFVDDNFKELVLLKQFIDQLKQEYQQILGDLTHQLHSLKQAQTRIESQKLDLQEQLRLDSAFARTPAQNQRLKSLDALLIQSTSLKLNLENKIQDASSFSKRLQSITSGLEEDLDLAWKSYFFSSEGSVLELHQQDLSKVFWEWRQGLPIYLNFFFLGELPWKEFSIWSLLFGALFSFAGISLWKRFFYELSDLKPTVKPGDMVLCCFSLGLWAATGLLPGAYHSVLLLIIIQLLLLRGLANLLWSFRQASQEETRSSKNPLRPLWWLFATSILIQGLNLPASLLLLIWPSTLSAFLIWILLARKQAQLQLEQLILNSSMLSLVFLALLGLGGWVNLSLLLTAFLFVLALCLQFGSISGSLLRARVAQLPDSNLGYLGQGLIQGTGLPLLWILAVFLAVLWLGINMGDLKFLKEITKQDLGWGALSVNMFRLILVLIGFYLAKSGLVILRSILDSMAERNTHLDPGTTATLKTLLTYVIWSIYIVLALAFLGLNLTSLTVVAGGLSVGIGFGLQSIVNNFISGLILLFGRAIKPGDIVQVKDLWAEVKEVNIRSTVVETFDKSTLLLPNSMLIEEQITNWTLSDKIIRRTIRVGVAHGSDIEMVKRLLQYIAETHPEVLNRPLPFVRFEDFGSSSLIFTLYFFALIDNAWDTESNLRFEIHNIFREYNITFAFPQQDLHIKSASGLEGLWPDKIPDPEEQSSQS
ncbi:MAG: mechanosensitive ion channel domain-containing protein [Desulfohalobiaceae bacterium]